MNLKETFGLEQGYNSPLSYASIKNSIYEFRRSGHKSSDWHALDQPGQLYFKIVFHFWNGDEFHNADSNQQGLLAPTWDWRPDVPMQKQIVDEENKDNNSIVEQATALDSYVKNIMRRNNHTEILGLGGSVGEKSLKDMISKKGVDLLSDSAYNYLVRNDELERADKLKHFITLLSNISSNSPWYFSEVSGLDGVLERPFKSDAEYIKVEAPKQITIKCMPDAMDNRIATLLDLYKDVVYSQTWHRVILPSNLRKFDMSIYIFEAPIANLHAFHNKNGLMKSSARSLSNGIPVSYKRIELHDCEIEYNAAKSGYASLNNVEGFQQTFEIPISIGDAYEHRYNVFIDREIGDNNAIDNLIQTYSHGKYGNIIQDAPQVTNPDVERSLNERLEGSGSLDLFNIIDDATGNKVTGFISNQLLGNLHKGSVTDVLESTSKLIENAKVGNIGGVVKNITGQTKKYKNGWTFQDMSDNVNNITGESSKSSSRSSEPSSNKNIFKDSLRKPIGSVTSIDDIERPIGIKPQTNNIFKNTTPRTYERPDIIPS